MYSIGEVYMYDPENAKQYGLQNCLWIDIYIYIVKI